jgi:hypothetical protein
MLVCFGPKGNVWHGMGDSVAMLVKRGEECVSYFSLLEKENPNHVRDKV